MKKFFIYASISALTMLTYSCSTHRLYVNYPTFKDADDTYGYSVTMDDDSVTICFEWFYSENFSVDTYITNNTRKPIEVIWEDARIDDMDICFGMKDNYNHSPETIRPGCKTHQQLAIKKYFYDFVVPFFSDIVVNSRGYDSRMILIPISFGDDRKDYYYELCVTNTKKRRLKEPPK